MAAAGRPSRGMPANFRETAAYLVCGALTVAVNTACYLGLALVLPDLIANTAAFFIAVVFAYWANAVFVFNKRISAGTFFHFLGMRLGTIFIDNGGMWFLLSLGTKNFVAKCVVNGVIIVLNYIFSKFFIFKAAREDPGRGAKT
jgi:putative flippase GtrA